MNQNPKMTLIATFRSSCAACSYSAWHKAGLVCQKQPRFAIKVCQYFCYEPGTDQEEKNDPCDF